MTIISSPASRALRVPFFIARSSSHRGCRQGHQRRRRRRGDLRLRRCRRRCRRRR